MQSFASEAPVDCWEDPQRCIHMPCLAAGSCLWRKAVGGKAGGNTGPFTFKGRNDPTEEQREFTHLKPTLARLKPKEIAEAEPVNRGCPAKWSADLPGAPMGSESLLSSACTCSTNGYAWRLGRQKRSPCKAFRTSFCRRLRAGEPAMHQASFRARAVPWAKSSWPGGFGAAFALNTSDTDTSLASWGSSAVCTASFSSGRALRICFKAWAKRPLPAAFSIAFLASRRKDSTCMASTWAPTAAFNATTRLPSPAALSKVCLAFWRNRSSPSRSSMTWKREQHRNIKIYIVLYHIILYHIILFYIILYYIILHYIILYHIISYHIVLYYIILNIILHYIILYYIISILSYYIIWYTNHTTPSA